MDRVVVPPYTSLGWQVDSVTKIVRELAAKGVVTVRYGFLQQDEDGIWQSPSGARIAWFRDPDGNVLSLTEIAEVAVSRVLALSYGHLQAKHGKPGGIQLPIRSANADLRPPPACAGILMQRGDTTECIH